MDHEKLKLLAQLKVTSRKAGFGLDLARLVADHDYARTELDNYMASDSDELVLLALTVKDRLGLMPQPIPAAAPAATAPAEMPAAPDSTKKDAKKYVFGPRG
jgi:hypothetical protein